MNHWDSIRLEARKRHEEAVAITGGDESVEGLLEAAARMTGVPCQGLSAGHRLLYKAQAVLHSDYVWYNHDLELWQQQFNRAHEYAHFWRHGQGTCCSAADLNAEVTEDSIAIGAERVDGYGPHERRELEANVYAREYLLPGNKLRKWFLDGDNAEAIAARTGLPSGMVFHQLTRALLGGELTETDLGNDETGSPELDVSQQAAAFSGDEEWRRGECEPPVLVDAGPGTGKTRTLVARITYLLSERKVQPSQILALTFSNKAADEMYSRIRGAVAGPDAGQIWMGTFHKFGLDLLRQYHRELDIRPKPRIIDPVDAQFLLEQNLARLGLHHYRSLYLPTSSLGAILDAISRAKDEMKSPQEYASLARAELYSAADDETRKRAERSLEVAEVYKVYQQLLAANGMLDYGDLLMLAVRLLRQHADVREKLRTRFRHILVDEYQDVNSASRQMLKLLTKNETSFGADGDGLWVVGDLRQAIYRFRGAAPENMTLFATEDFPHAKTIPLKANYRSQRPIVETFTECAAKMRALYGRDAEAWLVQRIETNGEVRFRSSPDEAAEAEDIVEEIQRLRELGVAYREQAVLCRDHKSLARAGSVLEKSGIPVLYLGDFFERPEIRDLMSIISLASIPDGRALYRVAQFGEYGLPPGDAHKFIAGSLGKGFHFPEALRIVSDVRGLSSAGREKLRSIAAHFSSFHFGSQPWSVLTQYLFVRSNYLRPLVSDQSVQSQQKRLAIYQFLLLAYQLRNKFEEQAGDNKRHFLNYLRRLKSNGEAKQLQQVPPWAEDINAVRMITVHAAKGLEFSAVHLPDLCEGQFPLGFRPPKCRTPEGLISKDLLNSHEEEEECLFFVGLSRAKDYLCLYRPREYKGKEARGSRLLKMLGGILPRPIWRDMVRRPVQPANKILPVPPREKQIYPERKLQTYSQCPLKYYYQHILNIGDQRSELAYAQTRLFVYRVWDAIRQARLEGRQPDPPAVATLINKEWEEYGPKGHAYETAYRVEAVAMVNHALNWSEQVAARIIRPDWDVELSNGVVAVQPDYVEEPSDGNHNLLVRRLRLGAAPDRPPDDEVYTLYAMAMERNYPSKGYQIQALYMTDGAIINIHTTRQQRKSSIQKYEKAIQGILNNDFTPRPQDKLCPFCPAYVICPSREPIPENP
ncbi:MAG TPA: ATP-dependent helicase [Blastocatellia bacterium]|nr:ATP-dependent helicase [Blastocatellia bacterium]